jgi:hypothetical protein
METPFQQFRALLLSLHSREDVYARRYDAIALISDINAQYLTVAIDRDSLTIQLQEQVEKARRVQANIEELLHVCQMKADSNLAMNNREPQRLDVLREEENLPTGLSEIEWLERRLAHDIAEKPLLERKLEELMARRALLQQRLAAVRQHHGAILPKMERMYEELQGFSRAICDADQ